MKTRVGAYEELKKKVEEIGDQLRSLADKVKDPAVSQANANGKSQAGATGEGAGSIILQESFAQNKNRVAPNAENLKEFQESIAGLRAVLGEAKKLKI